jgi:Signal transduction histidine kinase
MTWVVNLVLRTLVLVSVKKKSRKFLTGFYRIDKSRSRRSGGSGLGLSIVQALINRLGGHISLQSKLGVGTKVEVFIPHYKENDGNQYDAKEKNDIL